MKKAILTFGLFSLILLTSFTTENLLTDAGESGGPAGPTTATNGGTTTDLGGGQAGTGQNGTGSNKKLD